MVFPCVALLFALSPRDVREDFRNASARIQYGWTKKQVERVLGKPDDIWPANDDRRYVEAGDEVWCYGTNGHHTLPTLGRVTFRQGLVLYGPVGARNPFGALKQIPEAEIRRNLRLMHKETGPFEFIDPLRLIQVANALRLLGKEKALALLVEYSNIAIQRNDWLFWVVRLLFHSNRPAGIFRIPAIGLPVIGPPKDLRTWPNYPLIVIDDIPITLWQGASINGFPEPFSLYVQEESDKWSIDRRKLRPPDDPFSIYTRVLASPHYRSISPWHGDNDLALKNILKLVRTAYPVNEDASGGFDTHHRSFLKLACRWDESLQVYVRGDGSIAKESLALHPQIQYRFRNLQKLRVEVTFSRDRHGLSYSILVSEVGTQKLGNAVVAVLDPDSGKELHRAALNDPLESSVFNAPKERPLALPKHTPQQGTRGISSGFPLGSSQRVKFRVVFEGKHYDSPPFNPK